MAVSEHGRKVRTLDALRDEKRPSACGVVDDPYGKTEARERRADLVGEIGEQCRAGIGALAFGAIRDAACELVGEAAAVEPRARGGDGGFAAGWIKTLHWRDAT